MRKVYVDMTGVLTDFFTSARSAVGVPYRSSELVQNWESFSPFEHFFRSNAPLPHARELLDALQRFGRLHIVATCPPPIGKLVTAPEDIHQVVREQLDERATIIMLPPGFVRAELACRGDILIDDLVWNTEAWELCGGIAVHHRNAPDTLHALKFIEA